ncbi:MAG: hypothetical protein EA422_07790 [Gemmatimonadales bacterium]|nr:MAG: hypothetical protein EA422_07790 [Gemmatimonadales bacterium]
MLTLLKFLVVGILVLAALNIIGGLLAPILVPIFVLVVLALALAVPVALVMGLGWVVVRLWGALDAEPI